MNYQSNFDSILAGIRNELSEFKKGFEKLVLRKFAVSKHINGMLEKGVINMERQCWSDSQYSRQECLEVTGIPNSTESMDLTKTVKVFKKLQETVDPANADDRRWIKTSNDSTEVILKLLK